MASFCNERVKKTINLCCAVFSGYKKITLCHPRQHVWSLHGIMCGHLVRTSNIQRYTDIQFSRGEIASSHLVSDSAVLVSRWRDEIAASPGQTGLTPPSALILTQSLSQVSAAALRWRHGGNWGPAAGVTGAGQAADRGEWAERDSGADTETEGLVTLVSASHTGVSCTRA